MKNIDNIIEAPKNKPYIKALFETIESMTTELEIRNLAGMFESVMYYCTHDNTDKDDMMDPENVSSAATDCMKIIRLLSELYKRYERITEQVV